NLERALQHALQATGDKVEPDEHYFHTLATLYAEADKPLEAREAMLASMRLAQRYEPGDDDWYIIGRIAETYGVKDTAAAAYKRVPKAKENDYDSGMTTLVTRRLSKMK
ncbi:MAG TPA: hypothetical protein VEU30_12960, partial [Thermoanaerobaculia bacterium]|nr:hypothetical protein [Thermoanaerobaculia bacterium]